MPKRPRNGRASVPAPSPAPDAPPSAVIEIGGHEQWHAPDADTPPPTVTDLFGPNAIVTDEPPPGVLRVSPALFAKIQFWDREQARCTERKQEYMELAIDILQVDRESYSASIDLDSGVVTLTPRA